MTSSYTSKTSTEIKAIIAVLETVLADAQQSGKQKIDYNGTQYELQYVVEDVTSQIEFWLQQLATAEIQEGTSSKVKYFSRGDGMC